MNAWQGCVLEPELAAAYLMDDMVGDVLPCSARHVIDDSGPLVEHGMEVAQHTVCRRQYMHYVQAAPLPHYFGVL